MKRYFASLISYFLQYKRDLLIVNLAIIAVVCSLLMLGNSIKYLIDKGIGGKQLSNVNGAMLITCGSIVCFAIGSFLRSYFINNLAEKICYSIRQDLFSRLMQKDLVFFESQHSAEIITNFTTDIEAINKLIIDSLSFAVRNSLMLVSSLTLMVIYNSKLTIIVLLLIAVILVPLKLFSKYLRGLSKNISVLQDNLVENVLENFTYIQTIHAFNQQAYKIKDYQLLVSNYLNQAKHRFKIRALFFAVAVSSILLIISFVIWVGTKEIITGIISPGEMISFIYYSVVVGMSVGGILEFFSESQKSLISLGKIFLYFENKTDAEILITNQTPLPPLPLFFNQTQVIFENVNFCYPSRSNAQVLNSISFAITHGNFVGIVGRSGSGKSTILQLLLKFYQFNSGNILIGDKNIQDISNQQLYSIIAYVSQETHLFSSTIKANMLFAKPDATEEEIINALEISGAMKFIKELPNGINTEIGVRGIKLSGGQRQRIAISRAVIRNPEILLLDEATSNLDSEAEREILYALKIYMRNKTIISITHRISAIEEADKIILIDKGKIIAEGKHQELIKQSNLYNILYAEQQSELNEDSHLA